MAGPLFTDSWLKNRRERNRRPYRTSLPKGTRKGCLGGPESPFPAKYHIKNCDQNSRWSMGEGKNRANE